MDESSGERAPSTPQLLNLIEDERGWKVIREAEDGGGLSSTTTNPDDDAESDDSKLELKLGLPGAQDDERTAGPGEKTTEQQMQQQQQQESCTALSLGSGCFPSQHLKLATSTGAKRGFLATVGAKAEGCNQRQVDREAGCGNELTLGGENMEGEGKKGCCPPSSSHDSAAGPAVHSSSSPHQARGAVLPVVGWPPVRSFRRNLTNASSSKQSPEQQNDKACDKVKETFKRSPLIKINMDGIPIGRKINLSAYDNYQKLSSAVEDLFCGFLEAAQQDLACSEIREQGAEERVFSGLLDGTGEYTLIFEDSEGGRTLVGDLPWNVFASTAKRLRVMKSSELPHGLIKTVSARADN